MTNEVKILLASPRGFCAGVDRAIEIVEKTLKKFNLLIYSGAASVIAVFVLILSL